MLRAARWKCRTQKIAKKSPSGHHCTTLLAISSQLRHISTIGKQLLNSNVSARCFHNMVNIGPLAAEIRWRVWGTAANFNGFRVLAALLQRRHSPKANQTLHDVWPLPALVDYIYLFGRLLLRNGILPGAIFTLRPPSLALSYSQRYCTAVEQWPRTKL